jgi:hypothetical protein
MYFFLLPGGDAMRELLMKIVGKVPAPVKSDLVKDVNCLSMGEIVFARKLVATKDYKN